VPFLKPDSRDRVLDVCEKLAQELSSQVVVDQASQAMGLPGYAIGVMIDTDETKQAGWKFAELELTGIPVRIEVGPRDLEKGQAVVVRRDDGKKEFIAI